ncbi:MAG: 30S ribosome-binding factor RbfA [Chloroflexota bacterium]
MVSQGRAKRVSERIKQELSEMVLFDITDPRLAGVFITHVRVDKELAFASVFVSALEGVERKDEILQGFEHAAGYLRHQLAQQIQLRSFPHLRFNWDPMPEDAQRIDSILDSLNSEREAGEDE